MDNRETVGVDRYSERNPWKVVVIEYLREWRRQRFEKVKESELAALRTRLEASGFWFVDIPRTGSTTLRTSLARHFGPDHGKEYTRETGIKVKKYLGDHLPAAEARRIITAPLWDRLFTFSVVRNPWARAYSLFRYRIANGEIDESYPFIDYLRLLSVLNTRHRYTPFRYRTYFVPMSDYLFDENGEQLVSFIGRFENIQEVFDRLERRLGISGIDNVKHEAISPADAYRDAYCDEGVEIVRKCYADDIRTFNYSF